MLIQEIVKLEHRRQIEEYEKLVSQYTDRYEGDFFTLHRKHPLPAHHPSYISLSEAFWIWRLASDLQPWLMVESGSFHGYSAWWLKSGCPSSTLLTFDPERTLHEDVIPEMPSLWEHCFTDFNGLEIFNTLNRPKNALVFFDDHVDQHERVEVAVAKGFKHILLHDCYPNTWSTKPEPIWRRGIQVPAYVVQFPVIRTRDPFREPARSLHSWLTYVSLV